MKVLCDRRRRHPRADPGAGARGGRAAHGAADRGDGRPRGGHVDGRDPRLRADAARAGRRARSTAPRSSPGIYVEEGPRIFRRGLLKRIFSVEGLDRRALRGRRAQRRAGALPRRRAAVRRARRRARHRLRHQRPLRVLLPLGARAQRPDLRLPARPGRARDRRGAELLRARRGDRRRRRAHVPADRRRHLRGQPVDVRVRGRRRRGTGRRAGADAVARDRRAHARVHVRADPLVGPAGVGAAAARHGLRRRRGHDRVRVGAR